MRKYAVIVFSLILLFSQANSAGAANLLKINYQVYNYNDGEDWQFSEEIPPNSGEAKVLNKLKTKMNTSATKKLAVKACKSMDEFGARVKITNGSGGTAGLGNLKAVSATNFRIERLEGLPPEDESSRDEDNGLDPDGDCDDDGVLNKDDWQNDCDEDESPFDVDEEEKELWVSFMIQFDCVFSGKISLSQSKFYTIFINGGRGPEYSVSELVKLKWQVTLTNND